jgi:hypothetical protein
MKTRLIHPYHRINNRYSTLCAAVLKAAQSELKANIRDKTAKPIRHDMLAESARSWTGRSCNPRERSWSTFALPHMEERGT